MAKVKTWKAAFRPPDPIALSQWTRLLIERHDMFLKRFVYDMPFSLWHEGKMGEMLKDLFVTNPYRDLDRGTVMFQHWLRTHFGSHTQPHHHSEFRSIVRASIAYRMTNRWSSWEGVNPAFLTEPAPAKIIAHLQELEDAGQPIFGGAYIITARGKTGSKLAIVEESLDIAWNHTARKSGREIACSSMQAFCKSLYDIVPGYGLFMAYEVACDLAYPWTGGIWQDYELDLWTNIGPGAQRGMDILWGAPVPKDYHIHAAQYLRNHLEKIAYNSNLPGADMRTVEHWLCEYQKIVRNNENRKTKRRYKEPPRPDGYESVSLFVESYGRLLTRLGALRYNRSFANRSPRALCDP